MAVPKLRSAERLIRGTPRFLFLPAEELRGQKCQGCESEARYCSAAPQLTWRLLPCSAGDFSSHVEVLHSSELSGSPPRKEGEMCFWKQRSLLISCCSSWHPFAGQLNLALHLAQASVPGLRAQPRFFSACLLISALLLLLFSSFHLCQ